MPVCLLGKLLRILPTLLDTKYINFENAFGYTHSNILTHPFATHSPPVDSCAIVLFTKMPYAHPNLFSAKPGEGGVLLVKNVAEEFIFVYFFLSEYLKFLEASTRVFQ